MLIHYDEQRSFYRMSVDCYVEFSAIDGSETFAGEGKNLSADGVSFITEQPLTEGQELNIIVHPVIKTVSPLSAKAKVVRVTEDKESKKYIVGVSLTEVS